MKTPFMLILAVIAGIVLGILIVCFVQYQDENKYPYFFWCKATDFSTLEKFCHFPVGSLLTNN
jgi:hypothetical protein